MEVVAVIKRSNSHAQRRKEGSNNNITSNPVQLRRKEGSSSGKGSEAITPSTQIGIE